MAPRQRGAAGKVAAIAGQPPRTCGPADKASVAEAAIDRATHAVAAQGPSRTDSAPAAARLAGQKAT